jgi:hypothetical protein
MGLVAERVIACTSYVDVKMLLVGIDFSAAIKFYGPPFFDLRPENNVSGVAALHFSRGGVSFL